MSEWIESEDEIIFEQGKDPGVGELRVVGDLQKIEKNESERGISLKDAHDVVFGKGCSTFISEALKKSEKAGVQYEEKQFRIAGITKEGRPLLVVITPRDTAGVAKRIVTAWPLSKNSKELRKLLLDCPQLEDKIKRYFQGS